MNSKRKMLAAFVVTAALSGFGGAVAAASPTPGLSPTSHAVAPVPAGPQCQDVPDAGNKPDGPGVDTPEPGDSADPCPDLPEPGDQPD